MTGRLVIMVKVPKPSRVKTRLARDIGVIPALWWYRHQVRNLIRRLRDPRWQLVLAVDGGPAGLASRQFATDIARMDQGGGDLGARMAWILNQFAPAPTVIVGSDIPAITRRNVASAFARLSRSDGVIGPAPDGGYWLIGLRGRAAAQRGLFRNIRWSGADAMSDTLAGLRDYRIAITDELADVDTIADLK